MLGGKKSGGRQVRNYSNKGVTSSDALATSDALIDPRVRKPFLSRCPFVSLRVANGSVAVRLSRTPATGLLTASRGKKTVQTSWSSAKRRPLRRKTGPFNSLESSWLLGVS